MASIISGYQYDIFISYRHNDNRSGWVTEFVKALQEELATTIKEPVSVYFDANPHDGLLETHNVDKTLEAKLRCLIFIPIISQTYCDKRSFAWQHEFIPFNELVKEDQFGRDIRLPSGNVASRILPVKIHDLDPEDQSIIEAELGGVLRSLAFIFRADGVNRPLTPSDNADKNRDKTFYRDQINKVANAVKEIIHALKNPPAKKVSADATKSAAPSKSRKKIVFGLVGFLIFLLLVFATWQSTWLTGKALETNSKSIAVLPFTDMSPNRDQEYLGDGIAEEIISALSKATDLRVIGRTSSFQFKGEKIDLREVGEKLSVSTVLEGSVMKSGNKIRITAQLINVADGSHIWSERYDKSIDDIFSVQDEIAIRIAEKFKLTIALLNDKNAPTRNIDAYEAYLKAKHALAEGLTGTAKAKEYLIHAIELDPSFVAAYIELSDVYGTIGIYEQADRPESFRRSKEMVLKAIELDPNSYQAYSFLSLLNAMVDWDWELSSRNHEKALALNDGKPILDGNHSLVHTMLYGANEQSMEEARQAVELDPLSFKTLTNLSRQYLYGRQYDNVIKAGERTLALNTGNTSAKRHMANAYFYLGNFQKSHLLFEELIQANPSYAPDGYIRALVAMDRADEARKVFRRLPRSLSALKKAMCFVSLKELDSAFYYFEKGYRDRDINMTLLKADPLYDPIRNDPRFLKLLQKMNFPE
jgi:adenylate cyclase